MHVLWPTPGVADRPDGSDRPDVDVHAHYADRWIGRGGMRADFVASVDGAISVHGLSRGLQTPGDNRVFAALRDLADVIVVGADTARAEGYRPASPSSERRAIRERYGLPAVPSIAVVSRSLNLDLELDAFRHASADVPTLLVTSTAAPAERRQQIVRAIEAGLNVLLLETPAAPNGDISLRAVARQLEALGYRHQLCEGGPRLFAAAVRDGAITELCLSVSPLLHGPAGAHLTEGEPWPNDFLPRLTLTGLLAEDEALFCRYTVQ